MAQFQNVVTTTKGQALIAKIMAGTGNVQFTKVATSSQTYTAAQLEGLTSLANIQQTSLISKVTRMNNTAIKIEAAINNSELTLSYLCNTVGIYANDPNEGEILYGVTIVSGQADFIPAFNNLTMTGIKFELVITVGNAANVTLQVDPAALVTVSQLNDAELNIQADIAAVRDDIEEIESYIGYTDDDIFGIEADFQNSRFTRLAGAADLTGGTDFDSIACFGGRKRCIVADNGTILAYYGDSGYTETGKLTTALTVGGTSYPVGTIVQVMVYQPKFYYRVVPLKLEKITGGKGFHMRRARYYVSTTQKSGFKLHPAFIKNGVQKDYVLIGAYEAALYDVSAANYILNDTWTGDFAVGTGDKLASIANAKPISGLSQNLTRRNCGILAENRGAGWSQEYGAISAATQLLTVIEYGMFNTQTAIGLGVVNKVDDGATNMSENTGQTSALGNASGMASGTNGLVSVSYRGEENPWGNIWKFVDGLNIYPYSLNELYVADNAFEESKTDGSYQNAGITLAKTNGYVSAMAYNEAFDWLFFPSETLGNSSLPVGDYFYQNYAYTGGFLIALLGAPWSDGAGAGGFAWYVDTTVGSRFRAVGGRLVYVPA